MENYKAQGTATDSVSELTVPLKMLELAKFREAALMAEQYLRQNPEDATAGKPPQAAAHQAGGADQPPGLRGGGAGGGGVLAQRFPIGQRL